MKHDPGQMHKLLALRQMGLLSTDALKQFKYLSEITLIARKGRRNGFRTHKSAEDLECADFKVITGSIIAELRPYHEALLQSEMEKARVKFIVESIQL